MADLLGMDPARIERLRSPARLEHFEPSLIWSALGFTGDRVAVDVGSGVGFITLPLARAFPDAEIYGCDILDGMVQLLHDAATVEGLANLTSLQMMPDQIPLSDDSADLLIMAQVHHELDAPAPLLLECRRVLRPDGQIAIVDWKDEDNSVSPPAGRRVPPTVIRAQLKTAGFSQVESHPLYRFHTFLSARA